MKLVLKGFFYLARLLPALFFIAFLGGLIWYGLFGPTETCQKTTESDGVWTICRIH